MSQKTINLWDSTSPSGFWIQTALIDEGGAVAFSLSFNRFAPYRFPD